MAPTNATLGVRFSSFRVPFAYLLCFLIRISMYLSVLDRREADISGGGGRLFTAVSPVGTALCIPFPSQCSRDTVRSTRCSSETHSSPLQKAVITRNAVKQTGKGEPGGPPFYLGETRAPLTAPRPGPPLCFLSLSYFKIKFIKKKGKGKGKEQLHDRPPRQPGAQGGACVAPQGEAEPAITAGPGPPLTALPARRAGATCWLGPSLHPHVAT